MYAVLIYAKGDESWSTPHSIGVELIKRGWIVDVINIHNGNTYTDEALINFVNNYNYDANPQLIINFDYGQFDSPFLDKNHLYNSFTVLECGDEPQNYERNLLKAPKFDYIFTPDFDSYIKYSEKGFNVDWLNHWADDVIYKPHDMEQKLKAVSSRGRGGSEFLDYLESVTQGGFINRNGWMGEDHAKFLCVAPIVVQNSRFGEITRRIFEAMACKRLVLTDRLNQSKRLHKLFRENEHIVFYDDISDCISKMNYYYARPEEAQKIAQNGYEEVLKNHTQKNRVDSILIKYEEWKLTNSR